MRIIKRIVTYICIFVPSVKGVNTLSAKKWFNMVWKDLGGNKRYGLGKKLKAYRRGYMPDHIAKFGAPDPGDDTRISQRDYIYLQPINGIYSKWLSDDMITEKVFYPFKERLCLEEEDWDICAIVANHLGYAPSITEAYRMNGERVELSEDIKVTLMAMAYFVPQLVLFAVYMTGEGEDFRIVRVANSPEYPADFIFGTKTAKFLKQRSRENRKQSKNVRLRAANMYERVMFKTRKLFAAAFFPKGLRPYLSIEWTGKVVRDLFSNTGESLSKKFWAYRHGFLSYRIKQYGITEDNHTDFISDFEYSWLRHINPDYCALFEDKISMKYIVNEFRECFPEYYYHVRAASSGNIVIKMMDCPRGYGREYADILALARDKGVLALKPDTGSHGHGFFKLSYVDGKYYLNSKEVPAKEIINILDDRNSQYLVTEYISNLPQFREIYDGAVNTARMLVFKNEDGTPVIGNAYLRFGSSKTGAVDNMGAGGIFAQLDIDTGFYHDAKIITHNSIIPCTEHPDTGVKIEGFIPDWNNVKDKVLAVARSIGPMEYFGFDVAFTENGIKFPEINRFPDYPKIEKLSPLTTEYLLRKLREKKHRIGYDKHPCRKLVHLPKR